ncbi:LTA synthase family protein [Clostridium rectalis]|uniref:LTA synthase family protein n=1 Tax=Clostridium rectalis TaxID=2040295 RepID=UPI000F637FDE|nr:LTA synthase family protein [Clostridium rectalis]
MKKLKEVFLYNLDILAFIILVTTKILIFGKNIETGYFSYKSLFYPVIASVLLIVCISILFTMATRRKILFTANLLISILLIADLNYFRYFKDVISMPVILNGFQLGAVKSSVGDLFNLTDLLYFLDLIVILFIHKYQKIKLRSLNISSLRLKTKLIAFISIFLVAGLINFKEINALSKEQPKLITTMYNKVYIAKQLGNVNYHYLDIFNSVSNAISKRTPVSDKTKEEVKSFLQTNSQKSTKNLKGVGENKNLITIQVEALQAFAINSKIDGKEITPNLNRWIKRSAYFNNYFYQTSSGGTSDAEFLSNNSLYPSASGSVTYLYSGNEFNALPKALKDKGYTTTAFHGFRETFWNRNVIYPKYGFDTFYGEKSYNIDEEIGLGLSDKSFLNQSIEKMKTLKEPYYSFLVTLTSHYPFDNVDKYGDFNVGEFEGTFLGNYLKSIHYTDEQLGVFLDNLEKEGMLDNSIVVLYGDHYAIPKDHQNELAKFLNKDSFTDLEWMELQKVPMMIHFPKDEYKGTRKMYGGQIDLYPTLSNIFNLETDNVMGKDLFNSKDGKVIFRNGSFSNGNIFYLSQQNSFYDIKTGKKLDETDALQNEKESAVSELEYSDIILKHNLIKKFNTDNK